MEKTLEYYDDLSPVVVIALAAPYYPATNNSMLDNAEEINKVIYELNKYSKVETLLTTVLNVYTMGVAQSIVGFLYIHWDILLLFFF